MTAKGPKPKFSFDTLQEAQKAGGPIGEAYVIQAGDSLKGLSASRYGSEGYYRKVAHYNTLGNFRQLQPGQKMFFPPIVEPVD